MANTGLTILPDAIPVNEKLSRQNYILTYNGHVWKDSNRMNAIKHLRFYIINNEKEAI